MFACYGGNPLHVHYFIKNYELNPKIKDEVALVLLGLAEMCSLCVLVALQEGRSVLMYATESGNRHTVEYLIEEKGCDPTAVEEHDAVGAKFTVGDTSMTMACAVPLLTMHARPGSAYGSVLCHEAWTQRDSGIFAEAGRKAKDRAQRT